MQTPEYRYAYNKGFTAGRKILKDTLRLNLNAINRAAAIIQNSDAFSKEEVISSLKAMKFIIDYANKH